jgi:hypothetical protein
MNNLVATSILALAGLGNYTGIFFKKDISVPLTVVGSTSRRQWTGTRGVLIVFFHDQERVNTSMYFPSP